MKTTAENHWKETNLPSLVYDIYNKFMKITHIRKPFNVTEFISIIISLHMGVYAKSLFTTHTHNMYVQL